MDTSFKKFLDHAGFSEKKIIQEGSKTGPFQHFDQQQKKL